MITNLNEARAIAAEMFINFSDLLKKDVIAFDGAYIGKVWDVSSKLGEIYPKAEELIIYKGTVNRLYASVPWPEVGQVADEIVLNIKKDDLKFSSEIKDSELMLRRDVLDQQVVDTFNHNVRRVNDVQLLKVDHDLVIAHVDIGLSGLFRRLGWDKFIGLLMKLVSKDSWRSKSKDLISWKYVQPVTINPASMKMKLSVSEKQLLSIPPADLGDIIFDLNPNQRMALFRVLDIMTKAKIFENLEFDEQNLILKELDKKEAAQIVGTMSTDEATDLLERLSPRTVNNLLPLIESSRAKKLSTLLGYSGDSAGGLMTTEFVSLPEMTLVEGAIMYIKTNTKNYDTVPYIYIVDDKNHLKGVTTIRRLLFADPKDPISKTAFQQTLHVYLNNSAKEIAYFMDKYKVSAIPVIDENKVMQGIITIDDILSQVIAIAWRKRPRTPKGL
ncbi:MAG: CBS domain-containing protein [Candidatus Omnitrophica bacterium]|nr:CBS domain-containing protein [Candidatus Omnitrophota bacterium]MBU0895045.1 CBS domain-containing protein [Candidatus Omnitrophota bacterium]MBU1808487.1 CBS domain-containing protein [Candidatus Omnitrophota bacterium]